MSTLDRLQTRISELPISVPAVLELASVCICIGLFVGTFVALASGIPGAESGAAGTAGAGGAADAADAGDTIGGSGGAELLWLGIIAVGAAFVVFWTALVPLVERVYY
ncbi:uncharacterized protein Nmag_1750 [Natrialba magadii ATCC 43099]|uniref:Uncharacterized protein n=1 Tax=Natrialba magadii (strain ATCC 43099 / DSM 3394 / CCM 3739 / CIP 104546 / IAM 13178 / JCM 8861 / NBRC 102185 / NCIMB 2190 / MS3) TaxID=547559 RepID=D3SUR6_NATMM|nr:hypothetical protein [Natrialba magadii]ADD05324.1 uncharacterized protein Nmag_1750 [Natrialba magadii ATCC 43099]ELY29358.1 hypothetical protein C500_11590 [Natrialba magadii ATCC 43099]